MAKAPSKPFPKGSSTAPKGGMSGNDGKRSGGKPMSGKKC